MMKLVKKLVGFGVATVVGLSMATGALADTKTQDIEVMIQGGGLNLDIPNVFPLGNITLTEQQEVYHAEFDGPISIQDLTGTQAGWRLNVSSTPLTEVNSGYQLPGGTLSIEPVDSVKRINYGVGLPDLPDINEVESPIDNGSVTVASAAKGTGMGSFEISFKDNEALCLHIDALTAKSGEYESTVTWDLVTAP